MNNKLYLFSKFIYFVFERNYKNNNLNFQIIYNIFFVINGLYRFYITENYFNKTTPKKKIIDVFHNYFLENFSCINPIFNKKNYIEIKYLSYDFRFKEILIINKFYYDKSLQRFIIFDDVRRVFITLKN